MVTNHLNWFDPNAWQLVGFFSCVDGPVLGRVHGVAVGSRRGSGPALSQPAGHHLVRESGWYALGLLIRDNEHDLERALRALDVILTHQFDEPGQPYHGTFLRAPEEPHPPAEPLEWKHYDPKLARVYHHHAGHHPVWNMKSVCRAHSCKKIDAAIPKAVEGALARRLRASYTNIALMNAFMLCFAGDRLSQPTWIEHGENMAREIYHLFKLHDAFEEYNSPTYYGVDLYAACALAGVFDIAAPTPTGRRDGSMVVDGHCAVLSCRAAEPFRAF